MTKQELTPCFHGSVTPARTGIYQRFYGKGPLDFAYAMWDGSKWRCYMPTVNFAAKQGEHDISFNQTGLKWRGLASDPKASA